jgi:hypothetical protein
VDRHRILVVATAKLRLLTPQVLADEPDRLAISGVVGEYLLDAAAGRRAEDVCRPVEVERHRGLAALAHLRLALSRVVSAAAGAERERAADDLDVEEPTGDVLHDRRLGRRIVPQHEK